jgi:hypothetical protein
MEHTINLAAGDFVKAVGPNARWNKTRTVSVEDADDDESDDVENWAADWNELELVPDEEAIDDEVDFDAGDTLGKGLALINQVILTTIFYFPSFALYFYLPDSCLVSGESFFREVLPRRVYSRT